MFWIIASLYIASLWWARLNAAARGAARPLSFFGRLSWWVVGGFRLLDMCVLSLSSLCVRCQLHRLAGCAGASLWASAAAVRCRSSTRGLQLRGSSSSSHSWAWLYSRRRVARERERRAWRASLSGAVYAMSLPPPAAAGTSVGAHCHRRDDCRDVFRLVLGVLHLRGPQEVLRCAHRCPPGTSRVH